SLTAKLLERPRLLDRVRRLVIDPRLAVLLPFVIREPEAELALRLQVPVYGSPPRLWALGSKSNARRMFREEGVPVPAGVEDVASRADLRAALASLQAERPGLTSAIVKLNQGVSGLGNATVRLGRDGLDAAI